ncbi:hypothetical protein BC940DRAFT_293810 [Gongronella butleri]|nr:hypothetical protein BC940DRAFT_293810 [Gongronella butleri]
MHQSYAPEPVQAPADPVELTALQLAELSLKQPGPLRDATGRSLCVRCRNPSFGKKACQKCECASCMEQAAIEGTDYCPNCTCPTFGCTQTKSRHDKVCSSCKTKMLYWGRDRWDLVEGPKDPAPSGLAVIVVDSFHADDLAKVKSQLPSNTVYLEPKCSPLQHVRFMVEGGWESYQRHDSHFLLVYDNELIFINENGDEQPCKLDTVGEAYELVKKYGESSLDDLKFEINKLAAPKMEGGINGVAFIYTSIFDEQPMKDIVANLKRPATAIDKVPTFGSVYNEDLREWLQFNNYQFPYFVRYDRSVEVVLMEPTAYRQIPCRNHQIEQLLDYIDQNPGRSDDYYNEYGNELIVAAAAVEDAEEAERKKVFTIGDGRGIPVFIIEKFWDSADVIEQALAGHDPKIIKLGGSYNTLGVLMSIEEFVPGHQGLIISVAHDDGVIQLSNPTQVVGRQQWLDVGMRFLPAVMEKMPASYVEYVLAQNDPRIARGRFVTYF